MSDSLLEKLAQIANWNGPVVPPEVMKLAHEVAGHNAKLQEAAEKINKVLLSKWSQYLTDLDGTMQKQAEILDKAMQPLSQIEFPATVLKNQEKLKEIFDSHSKSLQLINQHLPEVERINTIFNESISSIIPIAKIVSNINEASEIKTKFTGKSGYIAETMKALGQISPDQKKAIFSTLNTLKNFTGAQFDEVIKDLKEEEEARRISSEIIDVTLPGRGEPLGKRHPLMSVMDELVGIFAELGFAIADGPEIEDDWHNFEALNFPPGHPARDMQDTFFVKGGQRPRVLRTHTSPVQIRVMETYQPPIRCIMPGKVYRCDSDITHSPMFHQIEGLYVDANVSFAQLKGTLEHFLKRLYGPQVRMRLRPSFFPFTEPSAEVDVSCVFCGGSGCRVCKNSGWIEVLGAGMVDPNVFKAVGYDPEQVSGFAFGMGVERIAMLRHGVGDIRLFFENDVRFLGQF